MAFTRLIETLRRQALERGEQVIADTYFEVLAQFKAFQAVGLTSERDINNLSSEDFESHLEYFTG